jgi:filamentous hemagglutinin family protein
MNTDQHRSEGIANRTQFTQRVKDIFKGKSVLNCVHLWLLLLAPGLAFANPLHPVVTQGAATFSTQGSQLTIHTSANAVINWSSFNIAAGQTTDFIEPSSTSVVWNHITDPNPTQILGHLDANGYVILQNQSGIYIGGNAVINAAGLLLTTAPTVHLDVFGGGAWEFTAPPPTASIINYGEINAGPAGSVFLISHDIENFGSITAPGGTIGLCAGEQVLVSTRADGRGFSAEVTLPQGSVDNAGRLIADAGTIALNAQVVNQGGLIQANSVQERNGVIEIVASDSVTLGAGSTILAMGDAQGASSGGQVTIKSGNTFSDTSTSVIDVSGGAQGGNGGQVEISAPQISSIQSQINGHANDGWTGGKLIIDPVNITLSASGTTATGGTVNEGDLPDNLTLNPNSLDSFSQILLQASGNITLATQWTVPDSASATTLTLQAGGNIIFNSGDRLTVGQNWNVDLIAGANFNSPTGVTPGTGNITMNGFAGVQSANGTISLIAGNGITIGSGSITSTGGGSILLQAMSGNIALGGLSGWNLPDSSAPASLTMQAAGNITMSGGITAGQDWSVDLVAGATFASLNSVNANGTGSLTLSGSATVQTQNGDIAVTAANGVSVANGGITTFNGGNIVVEAAAGNVNTGQNQNGYSFLLGGVSSLLGGISTAAGGNVTITAGGNVTSFLPTGTSTSPTDAGTGAFGPEPGVVTITAGGSVYGHYVVGDSQENGVAVPSTITAETGNAGSASSISTLLALSLVTGSWVVNAPNGSINLQEVRNPNGTLNDSGIGAAAAQNNVFNYDPLASVTLDAGYAVNLLGTDLPRSSGDLVPCIYPPTLTINAGPGGVSLGNSLTLFPSPEGELTINTTVPAGTAPNGPGAPPPGSFEGNGFTLAMSDSGATRWIQGTTDFATDHASTPVQLNNDQPVVFNLAGNLDDVTLIMPKETQVTVGGSMDNVSFTGQNLHSGDVSFFHVAGEIFDQNTYAFVSLNTPLTLPPSLYPGAVATYLQLLQNAVMPGSGPSSPNAGQLFPSLSLFYLPATQQLGYDGIMSAATEALLLGSLQEITYTPAGRPILNAQGNYVTTTAAFASTPALAQAIQALYAASQNSINLSQAPQGLVIGGPGQLDLTAQSMDLGVSAQGISSVGPANNPALARIATEGASINITLAGDLDLFASQISSWYGGAIDINVGGAINAGLADLPIQSPFVPHGIWTSGESDITVIAQGNINIEGSRIAAFDGGDIFVESVTGNVNAGTGNLSEILVNEVVVNPQTGVVTTPQQPIAGSGILATTLPNAPSSLAVGNITVVTPRGGIDAGSGGITQQPENGNSSLLPTVTLTAGTFGTDGQVLYVGNIDAGDSGVIAINTVAKATGKIDGLFISSGNSTIYGNTLNVTDLAGGTATVNASGGTIQGTVIAGAGINVTGGTFAGVALSQSVTGGGAQSALASAASATAGSQTAAAGEANLQKSATTNQLASTDTEDDKNKSHAHPLLAKYTGRVTVLLPPRP